MTDPDCLFCRIVAGDIPSERVYEDEAHYAFRDIHPKAPVHLLVVPKDHTPRLDEMVKGERNAAAGALLGAAVKTARENGLADYRLAVNVGAGAGQVVFHTHVHVMGGWEGEAGEVG